MVRQDELLANLPPTAQSSDLRLLTAFRWLIGYSLKVLLLEKKGGARYYPLRGCEWLPTTNLGLPRVHLPTRGQQITSLYFVSGSGYPPGLLDLYQLGGMLVRFLLRNRPTFVFRPLFVSLPATHQSISCQKVAQDTTLLGVVIQPGKELALGILVVEHNSVRSLVEDKDRDAVGGGS